MSAVRLIGLLSFYDEPIQNLADCIASAAMAGVSEIVALDGAYALFPDGEAMSPKEQHAAIVLACRHHGLGLTLHVPNVTWQGGEVEKRTFLFRLALAVSRPGDWFLVLDADEVVVEYPEDLTDRLERTEHDCADVDEFDAAVSPPRFNVRRLFRAQPITVETNHITYVSGDGRLLWGYNGGDVPVEPGLDLKDCVLIEHRPDRRPEGRLRAKLQYYSRREAARVERGPCGLCGEPAYRLIPTRWRASGIGPVGDWMEACRACVPKVEAVNRFQLESLGFHPDSVQVVHRMGQAPPALRR